MTSNPILIGLLNKLRKSTLTQEFSRANLISAMEDLLVWLNRSENNTDANCKQVDYFISAEILPENGFEKLPQDIKGILFDMGATLHDVHSSSEIAVNFESTPPQLLMRMRKLVR